MKTKLKKCSRCLKDKVIFKNKTIEGEKKQFCQTCAGIVERDLKKEKRKVAREKKRETVTEKKLDTVFSKLVRTIYPPVCHSSRVPITIEGSHCAHLISRKNRCTRWDLRNCYSTTPQENMFNQLHVIQLAKRLQEYYGIDIDTWEDASKQSVCKLTSTDRKEMFDIFTKALEDTWIIRNSGVNVEKRLDKLRLEVIQLTKKIM